MVVVERTICSPRPSTQVVAAALRGGATAVQVRNKGDSAGELYDATLELLPLVRRAGAILIVNDRLDVALASGADGVHLGPQDLPVKAVRAAVPRGFLIGCSTNDPEDAAAAVGDGASYIGCGTVYPTATKSDAGRAVGPGVVRVVAASCPAPVVAIGGITEGNAGELAGSCAGIAVVGSLMRAEDPERTARRLVTRWHSPRGTAS